MADTGTKAQGLANMASARYGVYQKSDQWAGQTVGELRRKLAGLWQLPAEAVAFKDKQELSNDHVIQPGDHIEFSRRHGEKG